MRYQFSIKTQKNAFALAVISTRKPQDFESYLLDISGYRCGQTGAKASASLVPAQARGGGGAPNRGGGPPYGTPKNTSTGSSRREAGSTMMPRIAPEKIDSIRDSQGKGLVIYVLHVNSTTSLLLNTFEPLRSFIAAKTTCHEHLLMAHAPNICVRLLSKSLGQIHQQVTWVTVY